MMKIKDELFLKDYKPYLSECEMLNMIAKSAYFKSEARCFIAGYEEQDWLVAEEEVRKQYSYWFQDVE